MGRTGHASNKGQYSVILYDKEAKNSEGDVFLAKKFQELLNNDISRLSLPILKPTLSLSVGCLEADHPDLHLHPDKRICSGGDQIMIEDFLKTKSEKK